MEYALNLPLNNEDIRKLAAGDQVLLTGTMLTARDAAHKRMIETLVKGEALPFGIAGETVYYMGPTPPPPGKVIGSAGPTTSGRMDKYTPTLLDLGLKGMIGKGKRTPEVHEAIVRNGAVYFAAVGGAGALLAERILSSEVIAYEDLGTEAVRRITVRDFPVIVIIDSTGKDLYEESQK